MKGGCFGGPFSCWFESHSLFFPLFYIKLRRGQRILGKNVVYYM